VRLLHGRDGVPHDVYVLFFIEIGSRRVHVSVSTRSPDAAFVSQQARSVVMRLTDEGRHIGFLIRDETRSSPAPLMRSEVAFVDRSAASPPPLWAPSGSGQGVLGAPAGWHLMKARLVAFGEIEFEGDLFNREASLVCRCEKGCLSRMTLIGVRRAAFAFTTGELSDDRANDRVDLR